MEGLGKFRDAFRDFSDNYVIIGGTACEIAMSRTEVKAEAYRYLRQYGAIALAHEYYDVMHTQSFDDMVQSLTLFCQRRGGTLA